MFTTIHEVTYLKALQVYISISSFQIHIIKKPTHISIEDILMKCSTYSIIDKLVLNFIFKLIHSVILFFCYCNHHIILFQVENHKVKKNFEVYRIIGLRCKPKKIKKCYLDQNGTYLICQIRDSDVNL